MPPVRFEPTISAGERPQTFALDRAATETGTFINYVGYILQKLHNYYCYFFSRTAREPAHNNGCGSLPSKFWRLIIVNYTNIIVYGATCAIRVVATHGRQLYKFRVKTSTPEILASAYNTSPCRNLEYHNSNPEFMFSLRLTDQSSYSSRHETELMHGKFKSMR